MKLDDPRTIRWLIRGSIVALILLAGIDLVYHHHAHFPEQDLQLDTWPFFFPLYGFAACVVMVWVAKKIVGTVLMRPDDYYQTPPASSHSAEADHSAASDTHADHTPTGGHP